MESPEDRNCTLLSTKDKKNPDLDDDAEGLSDQETEEPDEPPNLHELLLSMGSDGDQNNDMPE